MIMEYVNRYMSKKNELEEIYRKGHVYNYIDIVRNVVSLITNPDEFNDIDPNRIHEINDGDYQGTLVYVIGANGYQPYDYWYVRVGYGSCSGCDTLQAINGYSDELPTEGEVADYMMLSLHIVQSLKKMGDDEE